MCMSLSKYIYENGTKRVRLIAGDCRGAYAGYLSPKDH